MKCFEHPVADAVGICGACGKGICRECVVDHQRNISCRGKCEIEARRLIDLRDWSFAQPSLAESRMKWAAGAQRRGAAFILLMGVIIAAFGVLIPSMRMAIGLGGLFIVYGLFSMYKAAHRGETKQFRLCPHCGYNITGNTSGKCSECGKFF